MMMMKTAPSILVTGANGVVGKPLVERLVKEGLNYQSISRSAIDSQLPWDLAKEPSAFVRKQMREHDCLIHCAPIWLLSPHLARVKEAGISRLIVFSSTSVISKQQSSNPVEQMLVTQLSEAESKILAFAKTEGITVTVLRPSMIYGYGRDENVSHIAGIIKKYGVMVLVGKAQGLRQPVHADDLVEACLQILQTNIKLNDVYTLAGGEFLSYRVMVERIFQGLKSKPRILSLPLGLFRCLLWLASKFTRFDYTPEMANRMNQNLNYSNQSAIDDFGYAPQTFLENPERDVV